MCTDMHRGAGADLSIRQVWACLPLDFGKLCPAPGLALCIGRQLVPLVPEGRRRCGGPFPQNPLLTDTARRRRCSSFMWEAPHTALLPICGPWPNGFNGMLPVRCNRAQGAEGPFATKAE